MKKEKIKVGLVGYGYWGPNLLRNLLSNQGFQFCGLVDTSPQAIERYSKNFGADRLFSTIEHLFEAAKPQAVVIATPPSTHRDIALQCLKAGADILVEKPLALSVQECDEIIDCAKRLGRKVMVDHTFVYNPAVQHLYRSLKNGSFGELLYYDSVRINLGGFQFKTNVLWDLAPHDLSILDLLTEGKIPLAVTAVGIKHFDKTVENLCYVHLTYERNFAAHLNLNWVAPFKVRSVTVGCTERMVVYDENLPAEKIKIYDKGVSLDRPDKLSDARAQYRAGDMVAPAIPFQEALQNVIDAFHLYITKNQRPISDAESGRRIVQILEAASISLENAGSPVSLADEPGHLRIAA